MIALFNDSFLLTIFPPGVIYSLLIVALTAQPTKQTILSANDSLSTFRYKYQILTIAFPLLEDNDLAGRR